MDPQQQFPNPGGVFPNNNSMVSPRPPMLPSPQSYPQQSYPVAYAATSYSGNPSAVYAAQPQAPRRRKKACDNKRILLFTIHLLSNLTLLHYKCYRCIISSMVTTYQVCHSPLSCRFYPMLASRHQRHCSPTSSRHHQSHHTSNLPPALISLFRVPRPCNPKFPPPLTHSLLRRN